MPLRADCYSMYYSLGQGRTSNCQECRLSSALTSPATSHAILGKGLGRTTLHFSRQASEIFHHLAGCVRLSDQMLEKALMRPHRPPGVKEAVDGRMKRYNSDPPTSSKLISPLRRGLFHVPSLITILYADQILTKGQRRTCVKITF